MKFFTFPTIIFTILIISCKSEFKGKEDKKSIKLQSKQIVINDIIGVYEATIPCPDCSGIKQKLTLKSNKLFELESTYFSENDEFLTASKGIFKLNRNNIVLVLSDTTFLYQIGKGCLIPLENRVRLGKGKNRLNFVSSK